jgi:uncharacterized membrane protein
MSHKYSSVSIEFIPYFEFRLPTYDRMDSTILVIFLALALILVWVVILLVKANKHTRPVKKSSAKEELFGKKKKSKKAEKGQFWALE